MFIGLWVETLIQDSVDKVKFWHKAVMQNAWNFSFYITFIYKIGYVMSIILKQPLKNMINMLKIMNMGQS